MARHAHARLMRPGDLSLAGRTPYDVIDRHDICRLRYYPARTPEPAKHPVVIVPPLAVNMLIYDLFPDRSLVGHLQQQGHPVYLLDWGRPGRRQAHYHLSSYIQERMPAFLARVRAHSGQQQLILHGWSMGAIFSYCYAALGDPDIAGLVLLGPPCDYHVDGISGRQNRRIGRQLRRLHRLTGWQVHRSPRSLWHTPGWANSLGFKLLSPGGTARGYLDLLRHLEDEQEVRAHATQAAFLDDMVAYPGGVMQDILQYLITDNALAAGRLPIPDCSAQLADIRCPVLIIVGDRDPIITPAASQRLISNLPEAHCTLVEVPGGHMSIVSGSQAPAQIWPQVDAWINTLPASAMGQPLSPVGARSPRPAA
ncbi:MAG: alpha/beta fold hydrolase [Oceanococcaceae bacterium]